MKTLHFISSDWWYAPHFETDLEIIENSISSGNDVILIACNGLAKPCLASKNPTWLDCVKCCGHRNRGLGLLSRKLKTIPFLSNDNDSLLFNEIKIPGNLEDLVKIRYGNLDLGYAVGSVLVDQARDVNVNPLFDEGYTRNLLSITARAYTWFGKILDKEKPDEVYAMNGRHIYYRSVLQACLDKKIPVFMHERGGDFDKYMLFQNCLPHSLGYWDSLIKKFKQQKSKEYISEKGNLFYQRKLDGYGFNWNSFTASQDKTELPYNFYNFKTRIAVFMSSEFEFAAINQEWDEKPYRNKNEGLMRICKDVVNPDFHFFLRAHPNMRDHSDKQLTYLENNIPPNATYIPPDSTISSYKLLKNCDLVLTFGSTMGVEACYWQKPSIIVGPASYRSLKVGNFCNSHHDVLKALSGNLKPGCKNEALVFGALMSEFGIPFKHARMVSPFKGTFKGKDARKITSTWRRIALRMASWI